MVLFFDLALGQETISLATDKAGVRRILRGKLANLEMHVSVYNMRKKQYKMKSYKLYHSLTSAPISKRQRFKGGIIAFVM